LITAMAAFAAAISASIYSPHTNGTIMLVDQTITPTSRAAAMNATAQSFI